MLIRANIMNVQDSTQLTPVPCLRRCLTPLCAWVEESALKTLVVGLGGLQHYFKVYGHPRNAYMSKHYECTGFQTGLTCVPCLRTCLTPLCAWVEESALKTLVVGLGGRQHYFKVYGQPRNAYMSKHNEYTGFNLIDSCSMTLYVLDTSWCMSWRMRLLSN